MGDNNGTAVIVAAAILGLSILGGSFMLGKSIDGTAEQLAGMQAAIAKVGSGTALAVGNKPASAPPARRRGPDPTKAHKVNVDGAPALGPETAQITIVEFADFQ